MGNKKTTVRKKTASSKRAKRKPNISKSQKLTKNDLEESALRSTKVKLDNRMSINNAMDLIAEADPSSIIEVPDTMYASELLDAYKVGLVEASSRAIVNELDLVGWRPNSEENFLGYDLTPEIRQRSMLMSRQMFFSSLFC